MYNAKGRKIGQNNTVSENYFFSLPHFVYVYLNFQICILIILSLQICTYTHLEVALLKTENDSDKLYNVTGDDLGLFSRYYVKSLQ